MAMRDSKDRSAVTLRDVAHAAGVHPGTVSRALNPDTEGLVSGSTLRRVRDVAADLGYRPNPLARGLKTNRSYTVGVLVPDIRNPLFPPIIRGIDDRLGLAGYTPLIANTENDAERERIQFRALRARQVDGFITATARLDHELLDDVVAPNVPLVLVNRSVEDRRLSSAHADDRGGARLAVEQLVALGHRRIAHLAGPQDVSTGHQRHEGFLEGMRIAGLEVDPDLVRFVHGFSERDGARECEALLDAAGDVTAILAANDLVALGCYDIIAQRGLVCPDDISVVGFNDMPFADRFDPPLTTIHIPHYEIGVAAAELLLERLAEPDAPQRETMLPVWLVERRSTAPPPDAD